MARFVWTEERWIQQKPGCIERLFKVMQPSNMGMTVMDISWRTRVDQWVEPSRPANPHQSIPVSDEHIKVVCFVLFWLHPQCDCFFKIYMTLRVCLVNRGWVGVLLLLLFIFLVDKKSPILYDSCCCEEGRRKRLWDTADWWKGDGSCGSDSWMNAAA